MSHTDLTGVYLKIEWAKRHLADLDQSIRSTLDAHPYRFVGQMDAKSGDYVLNVHDLPAMKPCWSLRVGDVVHNLRSALDHLAWQLVLLDNRTPYEQTQFPIRESPFNERGATDYGVGASWGCYRAAGRWSEEAIYTEGVALSATGFLVSHAWLTDVDSGVIDLAWNEPGQIYFGIQVPAAEVARVAIEADSWGPTLDVLTQRGWHASG